MGIGVRSPLSVKGVRLPPILERACCVPQTVPAVTTNVSGDHGRLAPTTDLPRSLPSEDSIV